MIQRAISLTALLSVRGGGNFQSYILKWEKKSANKEWLVELKIFLS